jgi:menaquinone-dependent protoporphyrinogen oxidase
VVIVKILVATESRHGATAELGRTIGEVLAEHGHDVAIRRLGAVENLDRYDACVIGSAVYGGSWPRQARAFVEHHRGELAARPVWLFSSGPVEGATIAPAYVHELVELTGARDHHVFGGRLDSSTLGLRERMLARVLHLHDGDSREWEAAVAWGTAIGRVLAERSPSPA